jgi:hypothetical protein
MPGLGDQFETGPGDLPVHFQILKGQYPKFPKSIGYAITSRLQGFYPGNR